MDISQLRPLAGAGKKLYVETYGCQMNVGDSEILVSIMQDEGYRYTEEIADADIILVNTCSIRDNAEQRIWGRLREFGRYKKKRPALVVGIVGCMAERLREQLLEREPIVDIVAGPDSYRDMPRLVNEALGGSAGVNVLLSQEETYADVRPVRLDKNGVSAFIAIMRGCNNYCSYCVVPYTRGVERSRDPQTILREARELFNAGYREVTLLGQNVNSYKWRGAEGCTQETGSESAQETGSESTQKTAPAGVKKSDPDGVQETASDGAQNVCPAGAQETASAAAQKINPEGEQNVGFPELMDMVAGISPLLRVRFATSHPKDLSDGLLDVMAARPNICRAIHLPAQSGSSVVLERMNRRYTREWYLGRIAAIREKLPEAAISTDLIAGFCGETDEDHAATLSLMREVGYSSAFMFKYSERPNTRAHREMKDDISEEVKTARLNEIIALQNELSRAGNLADVGKVFEVLVEGFSKRSDRQMCGRTSQNKMVVFDAPEGVKAGDYVTVRINGCSSATLLGAIV